MRSSDAMGDAPGEVVKIVGDVMYSKGDKVRLKLGQRRSDAADMLIDGRVATIEIVYTDYDDNVHIAVTMDDDPGQDMLRELGIYRFFSPDEIEHII
ncbi:MAG: hypothetical protein ABIW34_14635 [Ginsengibacter sp.]